MVAAREVDASAIDSQVLTVELRDHPDLAQELRVIAALGPSTIQPVGVSKRFPPEFRRKVQDILVGLGDDPAFDEILAHGTVERFVEVGPSDYDDIRRMVEACEAANFMEIR